MSEILERKQDCYTFVVAVAKRAREIADEAKDKDEILELILVHTVIIIHTEFQAQAEILKQLLVCFAVMLQHGLKLR